MINTLHIFKDKCYRYCDNGGKCIKNEKGEPEKCDCTGIYIGDKCQLLRGSIRWTWLGLGFISFIILNDFGFEDTVLMISRLWS